MSIPARPHTCFLSTGALSTLFCDGSFFSVLNRKRKSDHSCGLVVSGRETSNEWCSLDLHCDHDAGLRHFPDTEIWVARGELQKAQGLIGRMRGYLPQRWPNWFRPVAMDLDDGPFGPFAASKRLTKAGDVVAVATPVTRPTICRCSSMTATSLSSLPGIPLIRRRSWSPVRSTGSARTQRFPVRRCPP